MAEIKCRHFNGYKPCGLSEFCNAQCPQLDKPDVSILLIHLGALGAVVRSTSLLKAIKRKYPSSRITWVTDAPAHHLLKHNPLIDRVLTTSLEDQLILRALEFEVGLLIDKSLKAAGVLASTKCDIVYGFKVDAKSGAIVPATAAAEELWQLGLSDFNKFFVNKKTEVQLMIEALELGQYEADDYYLPLSNQEASLAQARRTVWLADSRQPLVGLNTGCANTITAKKWTVEYHREVIAKLLEQGYSNIVLLGGPEDTERNAKIANGLPVISSPTTLGLRDGLISVQACDLIVTGDSLGMHMAIAMAKYTIAWFGPTCAHEVELYGRGVVLQAAVSCSPCWKRTCEKSVMCYDQVGIDSVMKAIEFGISTLNFKPVGGQCSATSTFKPPFSETSVLPSRPYKDLEL